jgi:hypothetical protein
MLFTPALFFLLLGTIATVESTIHLDSEAPETTKAPEVSDPRSAGCSKPFDFPAEAGGISKGIQIGQRRVRITLPKEYKQDVPAPLVIAFHDKGMTMEEMEETTKLSDSKLNPNSIVLYPEAFEVRSNLFQKTDDSAHSPLRGKFHQKILDRSIGLYQSVLCIPQD